MADFTDDDNSEFTDLMEEEYALREPMMERAVWVESRLEELEVRIAKLEGRPRPIPQYEPGRRILMGYVREKTGGKFE